MLKSLKRIVYHVDDLEKAKKWYSDLLNTKPIFDAPIASIFLVGDCSLSLTKSQNPHSENFDRIEVYWEVENIEATFEKLLLSGAKPLAPIKQIMNICTAKVIDPFGNIIGITGKPVDATKNTAENQPSQSAMTVAFCRALAAKDEREEIRGHDNLAEIFLSDEAKKLLADEKSRKWAIQNLVTSPLYGYFISRTAFIDSIFKSACENNIEQIVFLGAGYDTRAYRFPKIPKTTKIIELDILPTQQNKIDALKKANVGIPENLKYASANFKSDKLDEVLTEAGYDKTKSTLFIWEGVMYYLSHTAVNTTIDFVKQNTSAKSEIVFDYLNEKLDSVYQAEPFLFWMSAKEIEKFISEKGMKLIKHIKAVEMEKDYLELKDGTLAEKSLERFGFIHASVNN